MKEIKASVGDEGIELFKNTIFGPYLNIPKCNFQGQITKCLLLLELQQDNTNVLHIRHANMSVLQFSIKDFSIITGLKCKSNVKDLTYSEFTSSQLLQMYFPDATINLIKSRLVQRFLMGNYETTQDAVQIAIIYFVHTFILCQLGETSIPIDEFLMVEDGRYQLYPWGQITFTKLMKSLKQDFNLDKQMYRLSGMPYALNV
ncbi:hypothetical protein MTR67_023846 [Solanum verrucosum]|uniref:DUF1985 domain-containing protein n=1 Tax=Solanum verrucosum TaxID=315347 RepID=A0AAF0R1U8_SOLVR|nr:hypothetical protein MTR67_023846 [Solanum verrucosum]